MEYLNISGFPNRILQISGEYEAEAKQRVSLIEVDSWPRGGDSVGRLLLNDCIAIIELKRGLSAVERFQTICHEMLHLELSLSGYPTLEILENDTNAFDLTAHLESLLQHLLIMPVEQNELGYDPYVSEKKVAESLHGFLTSNQNFGPPDDALWQFVYSCWGVAYARAMILARGSSVLPSLKSLYEKPQYEVAFDIGRSLLQFVQGSDLLSSENYVNAIKHVIESIIRGNRINGTDRIIIGKKCFS